MLGLNAKHRLSELCLNEIALSCSELIEKLGSEGNRNKALQSFSCLSSQHRRTKVYMSMESYVPPDKVFLGKVYVTKNGRTSRNSVYGYYVPIEKVLRTILHSSTVMDSVMNPHSSTDDIMRDFCDGAIISNDNYFQQNPSALQIILFYDDAEFCNPIGHRTKKHSMGLIYWTIANLHPKLRSTYSSIFLLAVAHTKYIKKFGLKNLLVNFIATLKDLDLGIVLNVKGNDINVKGRLIAAPCDSLGSAALGGYKMPGPFSKKPCRSCRLSYDEIQNCCEVSKLRLRTNADTREYLDLVNEARHNQRK